MRRVVLVVLLAACDRGVHAEPDAAASAAPPRTVVLPVRSAAPPEPDAPSASVPIAPPRRTVRLVEPGTAPRRSLRYRWQPGSQEVLLTGTLRARAVVTAGTGGIAYRSASPASLPFGPWAIAAGDTGELRAIQVGRLPADLGEAEVAQRVGAMAPLPLPEEAVGAGAHWVVRYELAGGAEEHDFRILDLGADRATVDITVTQTPAPGAAGLPLRGEGAAEIHFDRPISGYRLVYVPASEPRGQVTSPLVSLEVVASPPAAREALDHAEARAR
jgi:hypothetical protein